MNNPAARGFVGCLVVYVFAGCTGRISAGSSLGGQASGGSSPTGTGTLLDNTTVVIGT
jgi:hypothetical protein